MEFETRISELERTINDMKRIKNIEIVELSPGDNDITGKFSSTTRNVCFECDAEDADFTINAPDADFSEETIFSFRKSDSSVNTVTITGINNQTINGETTQVLSRQNDNMPIAAINGNWKIV